jgi:short-subunit dehydrogenase
MARIRLKPLRDQTIVITGASSGIGLVTARQAAAQGARVVVAARSGEELEKLAGQINQSGGQALAVAADVGKEEDVRNISAKAIERFGGFDTWVNDAGVGMYGRIEELTVEDMRRLFDTNFWGIVYGSRIALDHLSSRGGAIINLGSVVSDRAIPMQGIYAASKHAVKGFTDALRMEIEHDIYPVSLTLVKPAAIDTPYPMNARNYMPGEPTHEPPVYAPQIVAEAILKAAVTPIRDIVAGGGAKMMSASGQWAPRLTDRLMEKAMVEQQMRDEPGHRDGALHRPSHALRERGNYQGHVMNSSLYTKASLHPVLTMAAVVAAAGIGVSALMASD